MADNAAGMEGVIAVQNVHPDTPIVWFSNDKNFVAQSYRLGVAYFAVKPIDEKTVSLMSEEMSAEGGNGDMKNFKRIVKNKKELARLARR